MSKRGNNTLWAMVGSWAIVGAVAAVAVVACTSVAKAGTDGPCTDNLPPAQYASMPEPATWQLVRMSSQTELRQACGVAFRLLACALNDQPVVYMMSDQFIAELAGDWHKGKRWAACLVDHELAHLNGWRH